MGDGIDSSKPSCQGSTRAVIEVFTNQKVNYNNINEGMLLMAVSNPSLATFLVGTTSFCLQTYATWWLPAIIMPFSRDDGTVCTRTNIPVSGLVSFSRRSLNVHGNIIAPVPCGEVRPHHYNSLLTGQYGKGMQWLLPHRSLAGSPFPSSHRDLQYQAGVPLLV